MNYTNSFIKYLGIAFILVALLKLGGYIKIEFKHIFSLSLAGFWFVLFNLVSFYLGKTNKKSAISALEILRKGTLFLSAITIIVVPFTPIKWNTPILKVITDSLVYLSLGIVIFLIGNNEQRGVKE